MDHRRMLLLSIWHQLVRCLLDLVAVLVRRDLDKDAELLILRHENAVLRRQVSRVRYTPADQVWLAALSQPLPRRRWTEVFAVTSATILAWHRRLVSRKWDYTARRKPGRPPTATVIKNLVMRMARENPTWGHQRVPGELSWRQFPTVQAKAVLAVDFVHVDTVLLRWIYALIAVEHGSRRTFLVGVSAHPTGARTTQAARNLLMDLGDRATTLKFLLRDRDSRFTGGFDAVFAADGIRILISPPQARRANAICERMIGTLRRELLDRILIVSVV
jgi:putative transposase